MRSTTASGSIQRSDTGALPSSNRNTPGGWSIWRPKLCPLAGVHSRSASKIDPLKVGLMRCSLPIRSGQVGDVDSGDDWADPAGAFPQGEDHQGDRAGPEGVPEHGPQGAAVGGDIVRIRTLGSAPAEAGPVGGGPRRPVGRQCDEARPRAADVDPDLRGTAWAWLRGRLRCGAALRQAMGQGARAIDGGSLRSTELRTRRSLPVRLEP